MKLDVRAGNRRSLRNIQVREPQAHDLIATLVEDELQISAAELDAAASHFLQRHPAWSEHPCRFDVVSISGTRQPEIDWIQNAFDSTF